MVPLGVVRGVGPRDPVLPWQRNKPWFQVRQYSLPQISSVAQPEVERKREVSLYKLI